MASLKGTIENIVGTGVSDVVVNGTVEMALCGYGSMIPRANGTALFAHLTEVIPAPNGEFGPISFFGNNEIVPAGTYYTITIKDGNGDIAQVNAYQFGVGDYDLTTLDPFDPTQSPSPVPPLIRNQLQILQSTGDPNQGAAFDGSQYLSFRYDLVNDGINVTDIFGAQAGNLYTYIFVQDDIGGATVVWSTNILNPPAINPAPNGVTIQTFVAVPDPNAYTGMDFYPISAPTWYVP